MTATAEHLWLDRGNPITSLGTTTAVVRGKDISKTGKKCNSINIQTGETYLPMDLLLAGNCGKSITYSLLFRNLLFQFSDL